MSGIYLIRCLPTGETYVGATARAFETRFSEHRTQLGRGVCSIPILQQRATEYGVEALAFIPLKEFPEAELRVREQEAIAFLKPALNIAHMQCRGRYSRWDKIEIGDAQMTVMDAARVHGLEPNTIRARLKRGLIGEDLIAPPGKAPRKEYVRRK